MELGVRKFIQGPKFNKMPIHYVERLTKKLTSDILLIQVLKEPLGSVKVGKKILSTISPMTVRKIRGKIEKSAIFGHFWAIFENVHFNPCHSWRHPFLSFYTYKNHFKKGSYIRSSCSKFTISPLILYLGLTTSVLPIYTL